MNQNASTAEVEKFFHHKIPLTRAMGVRVVIADEQRFVIEAPVALNHNHLSTAFGGSINAVATLAGYGLLWLELGDESVQLVIRDSSIRFLRPVREMIRAACSRPTQVTLDNFKSVLAEKGQARLRLRVMVEEDERIAAEFDGTFVALRDV